MEEGTKLYPTDYPVISADVDVQHTLTTQPLCVDSGSTSVPASVNEGDDDGWEGNHSKESATFASDGTSSPDWRQGDHQGDILPIHIAPAGKTDEVETKAPGSSSGCPDSVRVSSELDIGILGPTREVDQAVEAASPDKDIIISPATDQKPEESVLVPVSVSEMYEIGPNLSSTFLLTLPVDALHAVASFLSPSDFSKFGLCSKGAVKVCRDVFRRVRMHGFRCATEVITAWVSERWTELRRLLSLRTLPSSANIFPSEYHLGNRN